MERVNFLYVEVKVYPASVREKHYTGAYDWDTLLITKEPVLSTYKNLFDLYGSLGSEGHLINGIKTWINQEMLDKSKELIYQNCPTKASGE